MADWQDTRIVNDDRIDDEDLVVRMVARRLHNNESMHLHEDVGDIVCVYCALRASHAVAAVRAMDGSAVKAVIYRWCPACSQVVAVGDQSVLPSTVATVAGCDHPSHRDPAKAMPTWPGSPSLWVSSSIT